MLPNGKGLFVWQIDKCEGGDAPRIVAKAKAVNLSHLLVKIANGILRYNVDDGDLVTPLFNECNKEDVEFVGWHYLYGLYPEQEAEIAAQLIEKYNLKVYVLNVEKEMKKRWLSVDRFFIKLAELLALKRIKGVKFGLSSYRFPTYHPDFPWAKFEKYVDFYMPQVYWIQAHNPADQLVRTMKEYRAMTRKPVFPTGAAFKEHGWVASPQEVIDFSIAVQQMQLQSYSYWEWMNVDKLGQAMWDAITFAYPAGNRYEPPIPPKDEGDGLPMVPPELLPIEILKVKHPRGVNVRDIPTIKNNVPTGVMKTGHPVNVVHRARDKDGNSWVLVIGWMAENLNKEKLLG